MQQNIKKELKVVKELVKVMFIIGFGLLAIVGYEKLQKQLVISEYEQMENDYDIKSLIVNPAIMHISPLVTPIYTPIIAIGQKGRYTCSAFVVSSNYALTAGHCVKDFAGRKKASVVVWGTTIKDEKAVRTKIVAKVISSYEYSGLDMAALNGDFTEFERLDTINTTAQIYAAQVLSLGVLGDEIVMQRLELIGPYIFGIRAAGQVFPGMSGGPVIDSITGLVIGINSAALENGVLVAPLHKWKHYLNLKDAND